MPDKQALIDRGINGRVCGTLNDTTFVSYLQFLSGKDFLTLSPKQYNKIDVLLELASFRNIPNKVGKYNLIEYNYQHKKPSAGNYWWQYGDAVYNSFELDTASVNTLEILDMSETGDEVFGVYNVHYIESYFYKTPGMAKYGIHLDFKDCYFRAKIK